MLRYLLLGAAVASTQLGCSDEAHYQVAVYDSCGTLEDCVATATFCEELNVDFAGYIYNNAICTLECGIQGTLSPDCPRAWAGRFGSCYPSSAAGGIDDTLVCFEPCDGDGDCQLTFRCLSAGDLCGADLETCPIDPEDSICVPGPT
jgi:hypothetical protein